MNWLIAGRRCRYFFGIFLNPPTRRIREDKEEQMKREKETKLDLRPVAAPPATNTHFLEGMPKDLASPMELITSLVRCLKEIKHIQDLYAFYGQVACDGYEIRPTLKGRLKEQNPERQLFLQKHVERRHRLLININESLLEVIVGEAGSDEIDKMLYSDYRRTHSFFE